MHITNFITHQFVSHRGLFLTHFGMTITFLQNYVQASYRATHKAFLLGFYSMSSTRGTL